MDKKKKPSMKTIPKQKKTIQEVKQEIAQENTGGKKKVDDGQPLCLFHLSALANGAKPTFKALDGEESFSSSRLREVIAWMENRLSKYI